MRLFPRVAFVICLAIMLASSSNPSKFKVYNDRTTVALNDIINNRMNAHLPGDILSSGERARQVKDEIIKMIDLEKWLRFEIEVLNYVDEQDLVKAWIKVQPLTEEEKKNLKQLQIIDINEILTHNKLFLLYVLKQALLIPDGRIQSMQNWCTNFMDYFIAAYREDCPEIDQLGEIRLQMLNEVLIEDKKLYASNLAKAFFDWNFHGNIGRAYPFRRVGASQKNCNAFVSFLDFCFQRYYLSRKKYTQMLMKANAIDHSFIYYLRKELARSNLVQVMFLSPMRIMEFRNFFENKNFMDSNKSYEDFKEMLTEQEKQWILFTSNWKSCPRSVDYLRDEFLRLSFADRERLLSTKNEEFQELANLVFYSHFKGPHEKANLIDLFSKTIYSSPKLLQAFLKSNFPIETFTTEALYIVYWYILDESAIGLCDLENVICTQVLKFSNFNIPHQFRNENYRSLSLFLLFHEAGPDALSQMSRITEEFKEIGAKDSWTSKVYSLLRKDLRYSAVLFQPQLFETIASTYREETIDYPDAIIYAIEYDKLSKKVKPELLSRMKKSNFDHLFAATMAGTVLQMKDDDMEYYVALGEKKFDECHWKRAMQSLTKSSQLAIQQNNIESSDQ